MSQVNDKSENSSSSNLISKKASVNWLMLIYFTSGACSLMDEVIWVRLLKLILGNTVYASSIVVAMFMGGLALGALIMSRYADNVKRHLRLYAFLETLATISALSIPFLLKFGDNIYIWFFRAYNPSHPQLMIVQVVISACILLVPSILMGSTLPLLGRYVTSLESQAGHLVGRLYALNTFGAAAGCFLAGFVFIRIIGVMGTLYAAAGLNLLVAFSGWFLSRYSVRATEEKLESATPVKAEAVFSTGKNGKYYVLVLAFFMSGLISIGYEIIWMRSIVHLLGGVTYVFSAVLTIYLLGNVIGAAIGSRLAVRLKNPVSAFSITLSLLGLCGIGYLPLLVIWSRRVLPKAGGLLETMHTQWGISSFIVGPLVQSMFLFLVPAIIMGIGFPIALQGWANFLHKVGRSTGMAYGANTIGAVAGGLLVGFLFIPWLGVQLSISILGLVGIWIAGVMYMLFAAESRILGKRALIGFAVLLTLVVIIMPSGLFNTVVEINRMERSPQDFNLIAVKEGVTTTVSVDRDLKDGSLYLYSAGQALAGDGVPTRFDQKILGHFGALLHGNVQKVLTVGFGSGETTACLSRHDFEQIDCVEIAPEVVDVSLKYFTHINLGDRLNEEINMIYMDAKNFLHLSDEKYDLIMNDSIHPRLFAENASLYAKEYYQSAKERLKDGGFFVSWIPTYDLPVSVLKSITGTMLDVFPHVTIWFLNSYNLNCVWLIGSVEEQYYSPARIKEIIASEKVKRSLADMKLYDSVELLSCYVGDEDDLRKAIRCYHINTDYRPFIEFTVDSPTSKRKLFEQYVMNLRSETVYAHIDWTGLEEQEKAEWILNYKKHYQAYTELLALYDATDVLEKLKHSMRSLEILPGEDDLLDAREIVEAKIFAKGMDMKDSGQIAGKTDKAFSFAHDVLQIYPESASAWMLRAFAWQSKGQMKDALYCAQKAVQLAPKRIDAYLTNGILLSQMGRLDEAVSAYKKMCDIAATSIKYNSYNHIDFLRTLAQAYMNAGKIDKCLETAQKAVDVANAAGQQDLIERAKNYLQMFMSFSANSR